VQYLRDGRTVSLDGDRLVLTTDFGAATPLVPVNPGLFRRDADLEASLAFATADDGTYVLTGPGVYAVRQARWPVVAARTGLAAAAAVAVLAPFVAFGRWIRARRRGDRPAAGAGLGAVWLAAALVLAAILVVAAGAGAVDLGRVSWRSAAIFAGTLAYPLVVVVGTLVTAWSLLHADPRWYAAWSGLVVAAHLALTGYLGWSGWLVFRSWVY
jgi:hypothetical protein